MASNREGSGGMCIFLWCLIIVVIIMIQRNRSEEESKTLPPSSNVTQIENVTLSFQWEKWFDSENRTIDKGMNTTNTSTIDVIPILIPKEEKEEERERNHLISLILIAPIGILVLFGFFIWQCFCKSKCREECCEKENDDLLEVNVVDR